MDLDIQFVKCKKCNNDIDECKCRYITYKQSTKNEKQDDCCGNGCSGCDRWKK